MKLLHTLSLSISLVLLTSSVFADDEKSKYSYNLSNGVQATIVEEPFNPARHRITICHEKTDMGENAEETYICKIDGLPFYGVGESKEPSTELRAINITINGRLYKLNTSQMYNAWGFYRKPDDFLLLTCNKKSCTLKGLFSDATGAFAAEWRIKNGKSKRALISGDESVVFQFIDEIETKKHIIPLSNGTVDLP